MELHLRKLEDEYLFQELTQRSQLTTLTRAIKKIHPIKAPATILSMSGAVLVAFPDWSLRLIGFSAWAVSNFLWVYLWVYNGITIKDAYLIGMFSFFFVTSGLGIFNLLF